MRMKKLLKFTFFVLFPAALVLVLAFFFLTGSFFLTTVALPFLSSRAGVEITAERVELSVFRSRVRMEKLRVGAEKSPIFQAARAEGGFDWAMLAGLTAGAVVLALAFAGLRKSAVVAAVELGYCQKGEDITVKLRGGDLIVNYTDEAVYLTGKACLICEGIVEY